MLLTHLVAFGFVNGASVARTVGSAAVLMVIVHKRGVVRARKIRPDIDAGEEVILGIDFAAALAPGVTLTEVPTFACSVYAGADAAAASRVLTDPIIVASQNYGSPSAQVNILVGDMIAGVTYRLQCFAKTSDGQTLDCWAYLACVAPN